MRQYLDVKDRYPDAIVFFRLGDFYEMFFEDAVLGARLLDLVLTTRDKGKDDAVPMCGVPHHAAKGYGARLTELGHKVVMVEQVEDPKLAKGLVRREVARVVTPGAVGDDEALDPKLPGYLAAIVLAADRKACGLAYLDASTGELYATELAVVALAGELARVAPREILASAADLERLAALRARHPAPWNAGDVPALPDPPALLRGLGGPASHGPPRAPATAIPYPRPPPPT